MDAVQIKAKFDWLVELAGAVALALSAGFAALKLAPWHGLASPVASMAASVGGLAIGLLSMRLVKPAPRDFALAALDLDPIETGGAPLVLDSPIEEPLLLDIIYEEPLLLDDPLVTAEGSRVVQLFASQPAPTAGELKQRIDRHLAGTALHAERLAGPIPDATGALHAALDELRRSLR